MSNNPMAKKRLSSRGQESDPTMETKILEKCVRKILELLAIGFGEAGAEVGPPRPSRPAQEFARSWACPCNQNGVCDHLYVRA